MEEENLRRPQVHRYACERNIPGPDFPKKNPPISCVTAPRGAHFTATTWRVVFWYSYIKGKVKWRVSGYSNALQIKGEE